MTKIVKLPEAGQEARDNFYEDHTIQLLMGKQSCWESIANLLV